jgi:hypothetical protein
VWQQASVQDTEVGLVPAAAPSGAACSDSGPGTAPQPFCTISAAAAHAGPGQTVQVAGGTYAEDSYRMLRTLRRRTRLTPARSGIADSLSQVGGVSGGELIGRFHDSR